MIKYFKCPRCFKIFLASAEYSLMELACGSGCGGHLEVITKEEANSSLEK